MHTGTSLWDLPLPASPRDPETSRLAAREVVESGRRDAHIRKVADLVARAPGRTSRELSTLTDELDRHEIARRLSECEQVGLVRRGKARECRESGKRALVWYACESGGVSPEETDA